MRKDEFGRRRRQLMRHMGKGAIAILPAVPVRLRNNDVEYDYRPDSDFYYLTGFAEPESVAVLIPGRPQGEYVLFVRDRDPAREAWDGPRAGPEGAVRDHGADDAFPVGDIEEILPGLLERCDRVFYTMGAHPEFDKRLIGWVNRLRAEGSRGKRAPHEFVALDHPLHEMRLFKSRAELATLRRSAAIACAAHRRALAAARPGAKEYEVRAEILHEFHRRRADISYPPIVGSGPNACVLHYRGSDREMQDGELLLIDAGCEYDYYASDVTRTLPVGGRYSRRQRAVYEVVLEAQRAAIDKVRAGAHWNAPHEAAVRVITRGLVRLGLLKGRVPALIRQGAYRPFYMHRVGHWLGMDVHDVGEYKVGNQWRLLEPGMVTTIEPGIYIAPGTKGVRREWWGIGIRIEDDVAVTDDEPEVLTAAMPTDPDEIERLVAAS
ncbi:MAG TPA: aminopeptidase P N-terminal domain-containing protein [Steroidobacteraceae bacterium]|jgi:Xaa-Pro aminopeptidase|nr:aminopeptidase P N-terminal domain-containing protein [Steroidobacteraceae bacterium]